MIKVIDTLQAREKVDAELRVEHQSDTKVLTITMEILSEPSSNKLCGSVLYFITYNDKEEREVEMRSLDERNKERGYCVGLYVNRLVDLDDVQASVCNGIVS
ncbi:hypothetical protein Tco_0755092 [Tanacetum coccineum]